MFCYLTSVPKQRRMTVEKGVFPMKKLGVFLILGALCAALLAGCGSLDAPAEIPESSSMITAPSEPEPSSATETVSAPEESEPSDTSADTSAITMQLQDYTDDNIGEFPMITGVENDAVEQINQAIAQKMEAYQAHLEENDGSSMECRAYPITTDRYLNIVMTEITYPSYGTQGAVYSYNYDMETEAVVSVEEAFSMANTTREQIEADGAAYITDNMQYQEVKKTDINAFVINEDGSVDFFIRIYTKNSPDTPSDRVTGASNAIYTYSADGTITPYNGSSLIPGVG